MSHEISFKDYIVKRLKKIYPLFLLSLILVAVLEGIYKFKMGETFVYQNYDVYYFILNLLCIQNGFFGTEWSFNAPSWCISICIFLYVVFYAVVFFSKNRQAVLAKFAGLAVMGAVILLTDMNYPMLNSLMARGLLCFAIGVLVSEIYIIGNKFNSKAIGYMCLCALVVVYVLLRNGNDASVGNVQMLFIIGLAPMLIFGVLFIPWLNKLLSFPVFIWLGSISTCIYLLHFPVQCIIKLFDVNFYENQINYSTKTMWLLYALLTIGISAFYKTLIEKRYTKWLSGFLSAGKESRS